MPLVMVSLHVTRWFVTLSLGVLAILYLKLYYLIYIYAYKKTNLPIIWIVLPLTFES